MEKTRIIGNSTTVFLSLFFSILIFSCTKEVRLDETTASASAHLRTAADGTKKEESADLSMLTSPLRDILRYNPEYLNTISRSAVSINASGGGGGEDFHCCNGICLTVPTNPDPGTFYYPYDAFGNKVNYIGQYGPDDRQKYYVYLPNNVTANSPVVVMIPGGGWFSGQEVNVLGFPYNWGGSSSVSMVKDLLDNGYVVVSMVYRLVQLGNNQSEFTANPIGWQNQIDDITLAVNHIRANFSTCLWGKSLNANIIHILGESAGGHLALMYAYTHPNQTYIHSVISMYAPTNLQTMDNWINIIPYSFTCITGSYSTYDIPLEYNCDWHFRFKGHHLPYYWPVNYNESGVDNNVYFNNCTTNNLATVFPGSDYHIYPGHNLFQSARKDIITTPLTDATLFQFSPRYTTNVGAYPTFIMHGTEDNIVPYDKGTDGMQSALQTAGGVKFEDNLTSTSAMPTSYIIPHLIRKYCRADHGWKAIDPYNSNNTQVLTTNLRNRIRIDVITWLNNH
ncbi:MAG: alpha/beta hydrolase [Sphingobacteriales bacterium]|nr:alpha/beta hydrolase [Sphingobacteriales bacterium]